MAKPKIIAGSEVKAISEPKDDETEWDLEKVDKSALVNTTFNPRKKGPGDLIMADDWNDLQTEIKDDLTNIAATINNFVSKSQILIASGVSSHETHIQLNWGVKPHVLISLSGTLNSADESKKAIRCYPYDITEKGFKIHALSDDGKDKGVVNWIAFGVLQ